MLVSLDAVPLIIVIESIALSQQRLLPVTHKLIKNTEMYPPISSVK